MNAPVLQIVLTAEEAAELTWQDDALCAQTDPELFFPEKGGSTREAKRICRSCTVRAECLDYALAHDERFGIYGGFSERERRRLKRSGADLRDLLPLPGRAGDELELAPPGPLPLVSGQPFLQALPQPSRLAGVAGDLERVLVPPAVQHLEIKRGHGSVLPPGLPNPNRKAG